MGAGRALDVAIAEKVIGIVIPEWLEIPDGLATFTSREIVPDYSTNIAAAWLVINCMRDLGWHYEVGQCVNSAQHYAMFGCGYYNSIENYFEHEYSAAGATPMEAICRAALEVMEAGNG